MLIKSNKSLFLLLTLIIALCQGAYGFNGQEMDVSTFDSPQTPERKWTLANAKYTSGNYDQAAQMYTDMIDGSTQHAAEIYYNLGNAYFKIDKIGMAILNYSRALELAPNNDYCKHNLEIARAHVLNKIRPKPRFFVLSYMDSLRHSVTSDNWVLMSLVFLAAALIGALFWRAGKLILRRKIGFYVTFTASIISLSCLTLGIIEWKERFNSKKGVIIAQSVEIKNDPSGEVIITINEGVSVEINQRDGNHILITLEDGRKGWIKSDDVQKIWQ